MDHRAEATWDDAVAFWQRERNGRDGETVRRENALLRFAGRYLSGRLVSSISRKDLIEIRAAKLAEGRSNRTANYLTQTITSILRAAVEWEWIDTYPRIRALRASADVENYLSSNQAERLITALPVHLARLTAFCLETGLRQGRAKNLEWSKIDYSRNRIVFAACETKNRKPLLVPLSSVARKILEACAGHHSRFVFTYRGKPIRQPTNTAWYAALDRLGLRGVRFHDLRHTWASWHMSAGTDLLMLQKLGGWRTSQMVSRYAHLSDSAAQRAVRQFGKRRD